MIRERRFIFDAGLVFFISLIGSVFGYLIKMVLSRQLSLEDFGLFYAVFTFVSFFVMFKDFGLGQSLRKLIPQFLTKKEYGKIKYSIKLVFLVNLIMGVVFAGIFILLSGYLANNYFNSPLAKPLLIILSFYFIIYSFYIIFLDVSVGFQKSKLYSLNLFLINLLVLLGLFIFKGFNELSPAISYLFAAFIGVIFGAIALFRIFSFKHKSSRLGKLKSKLFSYGFPLLLASIGFTFISSVDTLILTKFRTLSEIGVYNVVLPTSMFLITLGSSLALVLLPLISELWTMKKIKELSNIIKLIYKKVFAFVVPIALIVLIFSDLVLKVLFGESFVFGSDALRILCIGAIFFSVATINNNVLVAIGRPKEVTKIILSAAFLNLILNLILIPTYGIIGAAIATSVAYIFVLILSSYKVSRSIKLKLPLMDWFKTFIAGAIFISSVALLKHILELNLILEIIIVLAVSGFIYVYLLQIFNILTFKQLMNLLKQGMRAK
jgi:O-antigen/teichoic acid export membrane protein